MGWRQQHNWSPSSKMTLPHAMSIDDDQEKAQVKLTMLLLTNAWSVKTRTLRGNKEEENKICIVYMSMTYPREF